MQTRPFSVSQFLLEVSTLLTPNLGASKTNNGATATVTKDQLKTIREQTEKGLKSEAIVISKDELDRMRGTTVHISKDQVRFTVEISSFIVVTPTEKDVRRAKRLTAS